MEVLHYYCTDTSAQFYTNQLTAQTDKIGATPGQEGLTELLQKKSQK